MNKLISIQSELKAPKGQYNSFGKYKYRSAEDILEAVKPLLKKYECCLLLSDEVVVKEGRHYVKATATLCADDTSVKVTAYAREPETNKGMSESQITGTASSYARKYALNGLFAIDDTKDADTDEYVKQTALRQASKPIGKKATEKQVNILKNILKTDEQIAWAQKKYSISGLEDLTIEQASEIIKLYKEKKESRHERTDA